MRAPCILLLINLNLLNLLNLFNFVQKDNLPFLKLQTLEKIHNISSMPAYQVSKAVLGSFNQANREIFGQTAGTQCSANCLYAIFWSYVRRTSIWKTNDLDKILIEGDKLYKQLNTNDYLSEKKN
eukprot:TCONS_00000347-protein